MKSKVLFPGNIDKDTGHTLEEILRNKHVEVNDPPIEALGQYNLLPDMININITQDVVLKVSKKISGSGDQGSLIQYP